MPVEPNQLFLIGDSYYAVNPATGQPEPVFQDMAQANPQATGGSDNAFNTEQFQPTYYFQSDLPAGAVPNAVMKDTPSNVALGLAPILAGMGAGALFGEGLGAGLAGAAEGAGAYGGLDSAAIAGADYGLGAGATEAAVGATVAAEGGALVDGTMTAAQAGGAAGGASGGAAGTAVAVGSGSALTNILNGTASAADWMSVLGYAGAAGLGAYGATQQGNAQSDLGKEILAKHQPFLDQSLAWMKDPNAYFMGPGKSALDANLAALSVHGNPATSPWALGTANEAALKNWQSAVLGFGNVGLGGTGTAANVTGKSIDSDADQLSALGWGLDQITNPPKTPIFNFNSNYL